MKLIVGLGNPEKRYLNTRHNLGFMVLDELARIVNANFDSEDKFSLKTDFVYRNNRVILMKPLTYMNLSGKAVNKIYNFYKLSPDELVVVHDDLDLDVGKFKFKKGGSSAGHNGLESIFMECGEKNFIRLKMGIGRPPVGVEGRNYVLMNFNELDKPHIEKSIKEAAEGLKYYITNDATMTMNHFNKKNKEPKPKKEKAIEEAVEEIIKESKE